jgi:serine phosphatase RsbU (regulator of sigma subunit)
VVAQEDRQAAGVSVETLALLAWAVGAAAQRPSLADALDDVAAAARAVAGADVALVRVASGDKLEAVAVAGPAALAAELEGTQLPADALPEGAIDDLAAVPEAVRRSAARAAARAVLLIPLRANGHEGSLELYRAGPAFTGAERQAAELAAGQCTLVLRAFGGRDGHAVEAFLPPALDLVGEALAAALDETHAASEVVRVAAGVVGATVGLLWELDDDGELELTGSHGLDGAADVAPAEELARAALEDSGAAHAAPAERLPGGCRASTVLPLGRPPVGLLQLLFIRDEVPDAEQLTRLATFGVRAAHALRASARARTLADELERTRALLAVVGQATAELSLPHTLEVSVARVAELLAVDRVALYLRTEDDRLTPAAGRGIAGLHAPVAERLLELALAAGRGRTVIRVPNVSVDERLRDVGDAAREAGIEHALAAPLLVRDEVIGLLAVYPPRGRRPSESDEAFLAALAAQLAVAVQNAQLHERATRERRRSELALAAEKASARRVRVLNEISRSFAQELSLDKTLDVLVETIVDVLDVDAALIGMPDERRELLTTRASFVKDQQLRPAAEAILTRPQPFGVAELQQLFRSAKPFRIERGHTLLEPFLARGWTAAVVPVATTAETIAAMTILSFRPADPITDETIDAGVAIAQQAALAIDNARLYAQQKEFADTMQRSLLPREQPAIPGLEVGEVYESSARVDVGGDVYDFLALDDGRLAVVLGDVTGHGVEATADMAMAKFVFRSLAREHPEPGEFLSAVNDVVVDEIAPGKFITMTYVAVDPQRGEVACANAGHPAPRLLLPDGTVQGLDATGLVLGVDAAQTYEEARAALPSGAAIVLYTDGVIEARRDGELYGVERLDEFLAKHRNLPARALAVAIAEDARRFSGGELSDDRAVVVIRRRP